MEFRRVGGASSLSWVFRLTSALCVLLGLVSAGATAGHAQAAGQLSQIKKTKKLYVDSLGTDKYAVAMREQMVQRLRKSHDIQVISDPRQADAVLKGTGRVWVTGHVSLNPRSSSLTQSTFEGYLSVELVGKNGDTLWSYLVSPSKFPWTSITDDLARQMVAKLFAALKGEDQPQPVVEGSAMHLEATLNGAGATFPAPLYQRWFELFQDEHPNVRISYDAVGSAGGIQRLQERKADFGASEMPLSDEAMAQAHQRFIHVPAVLGAVVVIYNVNGLRRSLNFTTETLAGIFLGTIRNWNDPKIRESNHGAILPDANIVVVHRSDGSGTSFVWTDYLSKISPQWKASVGAGTEVPWPVGIGAEHNEGVASAVQQTPNSIGYVEFIYALQHELSFGTVRNSAGEFVKASISSVTAAAASTAENQGHDFRLSITNPPGKDAYPISTYTWLLLPEQIQDKAKMGTLKEFFRWMLTSGQKQCSALGYAPLPAEVANRALESLSAIK
jgi:phosphate ABC transporter phosphate-binding protein